MLFHEIMIAAQASLEVAWRVVPIAAGLIVPVSLSVNEVKATMLCEKGRLEVSLQIPSASEGNLTFLALVTLFSKVKRVLPDMICEVFAEIIIEGVAAQLTLN
jgi:hypothetical protein